MTRLHPLLADAETLEARLPEGIPVSALRRLHAPRPSPLPGGELGDKGAAPDDLRAQRWGVVVPAGKRERAGWVAQLVAYRERQQGAEAIVHEAPAGLDAWGAVQWMRDVYQRGPARERPRYLLLIGDLEEISEEVQHALATQAFVGRLALGEDPEGYARYCAKVIAREEAAGAATSTGTRPARLLLYAARPSSPKDTALRLGEEALVRPCLEETRRMGLDAHLAAERSARELLAAIRSPGPDVLLSVCHGLGAPGEGFRSAAEQRRIQGALLLGDGRVLTASEARDGQMLPGGIWVMHACFSAATPATSIYAPWAACFADARERAALEAMLGRGRAQDGRAFVAALPSALLANPEGPIAVIGHSDMAWHAGYHDEERPERATVQRIVELVQLLAEGRPAGVALGAFLDACREEEQGLLELYAMPAWRSAASPEALAREDARRARAWIGRQDLRGYLLLGDPAARVSRGAGAS